MSRVMMRGGQEVVSEEDVEDAGEEEGSVEVDLELGSCWEEARSCWVEACETDQHHHDHGNHW